MKPSPITCLFNGQPHSLYGIYRLVFTISHHLYGTSHYLPWGEDSVDTLNQWGPLPTFYYSRPQSPFLWALLLALYGACCLLSVGFAACFLWDLLPAFCRTQSTSSGTHFYIVMETTLFYGARCLPSLGLAACFLWESLPVSHEPPPACFHRPGHPIAPCLDKCQAPPGTSCPSVPCLASVEPTASLLWPPSISRYLAKFIGL